jgi:hypothetical protein
MINKRRALRLNILKGDKSMKTSFRASPESYPSRAERVSAIKKAVREGSYEIDSTKIANILTIHLLNHSTDFYRSSLKRQCILSQLTTVP